MLFVKSECLTLPIGVRNECIQAIQGGRTFRFDDAASSPSDVEESKKVDDTIPRKSFEASPEIGFSIGSHGPVYFGILVGGNIQISRAIISSGIDFGIGSKHKPADPSYFISSSDGRCRSSNGRFAESEKCSDSDDPMFVPGMTIEGKYHALLALEVGAGLQLSRSSGPYLVANWTNGWFHGGVKGWPNFWEVATYFTIPSLPKDTP